MRSKISVAALFLLSILLLVPRASFATTVDLTLEKNSSGTPYSFEVNGVGTTLLSCLNDNLTVRPGESWIATEFNVGSYFGDSASKVVADGFTVGELEADAYLDSKYSSNTSSTQNIEIQDAIWSILDGKDVYSGLPTGPGLGSEETAVDNYITSADAYKGTSTFYSEFTFYVPTVWGNNNDCNSGDEPQQFMGYTPGITPEPSSLVLLGTGIIGLAGAMRLRMKAPKQA